MLFHGILQLILPIRNRQTVLLYFPTIPDISWTEDLLANQEGFPFTSFMSFIYCLTLHAQSKEIGLLVLQISAADGATITKSFSHVIPSIRRTEKKKSTKGIVMY